MISKYPPIPLKNEFEIFFKMSFKMTKQSNQKPVFKNKSFSITEPKIPVA
ncbi:hypothetical protein JT171_05585 [Helicobacter pylori]|nr:hypothetical protein [Helicobacter pylori]